MAMPFIAHVNTTVYTGGAARTVALLADVLNRSHRAKCDVIIGRGRSDELRSVQSLDPGRIATILNVFAFRLLGSEAPLSRSRWELYLPELQKYDLIHLHNAHGYYLPMGALERILERPCVWTLHDYWLGTGRECYPPRSSTSKASWVSRMAPFYGRGYPVEFVDRSAWRGARLRALVGRHRPALIVPTADMLRRLGELGLEGLDVTVIPHGIFPDSQPEPAWDRDAARHALGIPADDFMVLFAAAQVDHPIKGFRCLAEAIRPIRENSFSLHVAGGRDQASRRLVGNGVTFHGQTDAGRMEMLMAACDLYVSPSYDETFGLTVVEALGQGARVLCSDLPVLREVSQGAASYFPVGDSRALAVLLQESIAEGCEQPSTRLQRARMIRRYYRFGSWASAHLHLYHRVICRGEV
ncbi:glycosyltransferase [Indioceanicola profundi]|uniref:glycosyltransferase n=1 Tax=Indioceanicola profundi TaxID=2220096 RepID=UPI000E6AB239|nr:glycosyltransferase [Indioceanicola profundi]